MEAVVRQLEGIESCLSNLSEKMDQFNARLIALEQHKEENQPKSPKVILMFKSSTLDG